ncbi:MAG: pyroglutamyl-peptidase I [Pirellulaceae bacterium]|nr:pyroglutamyl-peptidase I [Pirellulaceae bacterium]
MPTVLVTAYEPYDTWQENSSWLTLIELTKSLPETPAITTRLYPVDFAGMRKRLTDDLEGDFDYALHLGQAPGIGNVQLEAVGLNVGGSSEQTPDEYKPLVAEGPVAYRSDLPLVEWADKLRKAGIPSQVSYHAGTFLCNATLYLSHYLAEQKRLKTRSTFIHLPLEISQTLSSSEDFAAMPVGTLVAAVRLILDELATAP